MSFLRSTRLKSCFGEHDFSRDFARPGRKGLRSGEEAHRESVSLPATPALALPGVREAAEGLPGVRGGGEGLEAGDC